MKTKSMLCWFNALVGFALTLNVMPGCSRPTSTGATSRTSASTEESLEAVKETLRKESDYSSCQAAIQQINSYLSSRSHPQLGQLVAARKEERDKWAGPFDFDAGEKAEIDSATFTLLDVHHLDLCFLMRNVAKLLDLEGLPPLEQASAAFSWTNRQARLQERKGELVPPQFVLRRGAGTATERALVFLTLIRQLDLAGCVVACPGSGENRPLHPWVPGVLIDKEIYLFDTRLGLPLPGPGGQGVATLSQIRSNPDLLKQLKGNEKYPYDVTPEKTKGAVIWVPVFLSTVAPRLKYLEDLLAPQIKINLAADPVSDLDVFQKAAQKQGLEARLWSPAEDSQAPVRVLPRFLPPGQGGSDRVGVRIVELYRDLIPLEKMPKQIQDMGGEPGRRLRQMFTGNFIAFQKPRELMVGGRFEQATEMLVAIRDQLKQVTLTPDPDLEKKVAHWSNDIRDAQSKLVVIRERQAGKEELRQAEEAVERVWRDGEPVLTQLIWLSSADQIGSEATYLMALCKQEQAERRQRKLEARGKDADEADRQEAVSAWREAGDWWETYLSEYATAAPAAAARSFLARAREMLGENQRAATLLEDLSGQLTDLEKTSRLFRARQLKK